MKFLEILTESEDDRMIAKAKKVYKAYKKGRGKVKAMPWYPPVDISYELPDIKLCEFKIRPSWEDETEMMVFITMHKPVNYEIHNLEEIGDGITKENIVQRYSSDIGYVYRKKFDHFNIAIGEAI
jgi:hypothetical protein